MMDDLKQLALFAEVVRAGSLSAAARHLGISTSAVSQQLRALEQSHGVTLLHRSTRKLALTGAGAQLATHATAIVDAAARARAQLSRTRDAPEGELRVSAPAGFARHLAPALAPLLVQYPSLTLRLQVDDRMIDLIDARIDLAIRGGRLPDANLAARPLCDISFMLFAAPAYLAAAGTPASPADLPAHQWLAVSREGEPVHMQFQSGDGVTQAVEVVPRVTCNSHLSLQQLCVAGLGLALMVRMDADIDLRSGHLVPVLPDWTVPTLRLWAVTPQRDGKPAKVRHAIAALERHLMDQPGTRPV